MLRDLPYDMGNAGDLVKHGALSEFVDCWARLAGRPLTFLDPFGGRPWQEPINAEVSNRLRALRGTALATGQSSPETRYFGSSLLVRNLAEVLGLTATVLVSDRDPEAREALVGQGFPEITFEGFSAVNGFSVLQCMHTADLILIDPFGEFLVNDAPTVIPLIAAAAEISTVLLFALDLDRCNSVGRRFAELKDTHLPYHMTLRCGKCLGSRVRGEDVYDCEVIVVPARGMTNALKVQLQRQFSVLSERLAAVLPARVTFSVTPGRPRIQ